MSYPSIHGADATAVAARAPRTPPAFAADRALTRAGRMDALAAALHEAAGWERAAALQHASPRGSDAVARAFEADARAALHMYPNVRALLYPELSS